MPGGREGRYSVGGISAAIVTAQVVKYPSARRSAARRDTARGVSDAARR